MSSTCPPRLMFCLLPRLLIYLETTANLDTSNNTLGDKSSFSYRLAPDKVTDEFVCNNDIPRMVELVMQLQHEIVHHSIANQSNEEEGTDGNSTVLDILALDKATDEFVSNDETPIVDEPVLQLQH